MAVTFSAGIRKHLCSQPKTLTLLTVNVWAGFMIAEFKGKMCIFPQSGLVLSNPSGGQKTGL